MEIRAPWVRMRNKQAQIDNMAVHLRALPVTFCTHFLCVEGRPRNGRFRCWEVHHSVVVALDKRPMLQLVWTGSTKRGA